MDNDFDVLTFNSAERLKTDELHQRISPIRERGNYGFQAVTHFPRFNAIIQHKELTGPLNYAMLKVGESEYNLFEGLPESYTLYSSPFTGSHSRQLRRVNIPIINSKGNLISGMHEIAHAKGQSMATQEYLSSLDEALRAKHLGSITPEQRNIILLEEERAWAMAQQDLKKAQEVLGIQIIKDENSLQEYVNTRLNTYRGIYNS